MSHPYWPLFDLRVRTPRLELRPPTDEDVVELARLAARGVHEPGWMPFLVPWTDAPSPDMERGVLQYHWRVRGDWKPEDWRLELVVLEDGEIVGSQGMHGEQFARLRAVESGSWVGRSQQGRGIGKEMRAAMLHLAFAGLGADVAYSGAWQDNTASMAVSLANGYEENGDRVGARGHGDVGHELLFKLTRDRWAATRWLDVSIDGLEPCLPLFGLGAPVGSGRA